MIEIEHIYTLPEITFIGGETQTIQIYLRIPKPLDIPYNAVGCSVDLSIINSNNKTGNPILSKSGTLLTDSDGIPSIVEFELLPKETAALYGKYIYQISIIGRNKKTEIPNQGFMFISKNVNQQFIMGN